MRKKYLALLTAFAAAAMLVVAGCSENGTGNDDDDPDGTTVTATDLVGTWSMNSMDAKLSVTTSSAQTAWDIFGAGAGALTVSGAHTASLAYMMVMGSMGRVTDYPASAGDEYPNVALMVMTRSMGPGGMVQMVSMEYNVSENSSIDYSAQASYILDTVAHTLILSNVVLLNGAGDDSVTVTGTVTQRSVAVPSGVKTEVAGFTQDGLDMELHLAADLTFFQVESVTDDPETSTGIWEINGNILSVYDDPDSSGTDTTDVVVTLNGDNLAGVMVDNAWCEEGEVIDSCHADAEGMFGLDAGSLTDIVNDGTVNMTRTSATPKTASTKKGISSLLCSSCLRKATTRF